jgi:hypothetical protein
MASKNDKYAPPCSIRLTVEERKKLEAYAGDMTLSDFIRSRLFDVPSPRKKFRRLRADQVLLAKIWVELRHQHISNNLNRVVKAIEEGELETSDRLDMQLHLLRSDLRRLRRYIREALGHDLPKGQWGGRR